MLYFVNKAGFAKPIWRFIAGAGWLRVPFLRPLTYEELFYSRRAPLGHYVFTDFDRMSAYEIACAASLAQQLRTADPQIRIYNDPVRVLERAPMLDRLHRLGINDFGVTRIDTGERPPKYPVFIRCEDDCMPPETGLINNDVEFDAALDDLRRRGIPAKRRIAVQYHAELAPDGYFRKYGALKLGGHILLQHIQRNTHWYVKRAQVEPDAAFREEYLALFDNFTHVPELERIFVVAGIDYGRADYSIVDGRVQVYEINSNPTIPKLKREGGGARYARLGPQLINAFADLNAPHASGRPIRFELANPPFQRFVRPDLLSRSDTLSYWFRATMSKVREPVIPGFEGAR